MKSRRFMLALAILILTVVHYQLLVAAGRATLTNNVFNDVVVAIANIDSDVDSDSINSFITTLKNLLQDTSEALYSASDNRFSFGTITLMLPATWKNWNATTKVGNTPSFNIPYNTQTLNSADIIIDVTNVAYAFMPYTQQSGFCGERGDFIHLTYLFISGSYDRLKYGSQSKLLAREWVKYYFGVYDEQGYDYDYMYPVKYFSPAAEPILNLCNTSQISWFSYSCSEDSAVQGLPASCDLTVDKQQSYDTNTSMMSLPLVPVASKFCSKNNHNSYAPNKQNIMCDGKSVMEIVLQNLQVKEYGSFKLADINITVEQQTFNDTLAMSILYDNMDSEKTMYSCVPSLSKFVQYDLPLNAWISLQESATENTTQPWIQINSEDDRSLVLDAIANVQIESEETFLIEAFDNLITSSMNMSNNIKVLLVVTASDTSSADWTYMCETATENSFQLRLISYSSTSVENFLSNGNCSGTAIQIQKQPCPDSFTVKQSQVDDCCTYLQQRKMFDEFIRAIPNAVAPNLYQPPQTFYEELSQATISRSLYITSIASSSQNVLQNRFYYETCENMNLSDTSKPRCTVDDCREETIDCELDSNQTQTYCADQVLCLDTSPVYINCYEKVGKYPYLVYVVGQPNNLNGSAPAQPITLYSWTVSDYSSPYVRVRLFARLVIGTTPIFNASVQATVFSTDQPDVLITLRDDGSGNPDISAGDGVYSAYFTQYNSNSVYTVTVTATEQNYDPTTYPTSSYPWISGEQSMGLIRTGPFTRVVSAGSFYINPSSRAQEMPPGRIMDLQATYSNKDEVGLQWTTPGEQLDFQQGQGYYLKCSTDLTDLNETLFHSSSSSFYSSSQAPGSKSQHIISGDVDDQSHYCSIMTCNHFGYCGTPSNIVTYSIVFPADRHYRIVLWTSIGIVIVILLAVGITVIVLYRKERYFTSNHARETTRTTLSNECEDGNAIPMECLPNELPSQNLDLPPSYEDVVINSPPPTSEGDISDGVGDN